ncbi:MAG: selenocysteine-specific translation elongation factor [Novosphingobium sp.]
MLVATAGHIDHGKTALIRALTGTDTDRLPEERARGISIDLGFAHWRPDAGEAIGFVDVPGHRRYLRNMLAGVGGVHFALLAIAADDGPMPQTVEHLQILDLLGIAHGAVAVTKCDKASAEQIAEVRGKVERLLAGSSLAQAPVFEVSAQSGAGIDALARALIEARGRFAAVADEARAFRMAIDRAFTVTGSGTVVTGTVTAGMARPGQMLMLSPQGREVRVRGLQSGGVSVEAVAPGQRCALNLAQVEASEVHRGDWLVETAQHVPTSRIEASVRLIAKAPLRHASRVHLHHGAADLCARILLPRQRAIQPGETALVQLVLDTPTSAVTGERFILRDASGQALLGGGEVRNPLPGEKRRPAALREAVAAALALDSPASALAALAAMPHFECDTGWLARCHGLKPEAMQALLSQCDIVLAGSERQIALARTRFEALGDRLVEALGRHHIDRPETGGMTRRELRGALDEGLSAGLLSVLLDDLLAAGRIAASGPLLCLPGHVPSFSPAETAMWNAALAALEGSTTRAVRIGELAQELHTGEAAVRAMLYRRRLAGQVWQVTENRFMLNRHVAELAALASELDRRHGGFSAAQFRDASGIGRNFVIELLEFFDRIGVTRRQGEKRRMRPGFEAVLGVAEPQSG